MVLGNRDHERFWIALVIRFAFGFMFLIAAMNILFSEWSPQKDFFENAGTNLPAFVDGLSKPYEASWVNFKLFQKDLGIGVVRGFLYAMPFIFTVLSILLLTGLWYRIALRASAIFLVLLGLGKYLTDFRSGNTVTTLQDFMYAMFITLALFTLSKEPAEGEAGA